MASTSIHKNSHKRSTPYIWIVFTIIIPLIAALTLTFIVLSYAGISVTDWAKDKVDQLPGTSSVLSVKEEKDKEGTSMDHADMWQKKLTNKDEEIDELTRTIQHLQTSNQTLEQKIIKLEKGREDEPNVEQTSQNQEVLTSIAQSFNKMDNSQAALIIDQLDEKLAIDLLEKLSNNNRGRILEAMDPSQAAKLTKAFVNQAS